MIILKMAVYFFLVCFAIMFKVISINVQGLHQQHRRLVAFQALRNFDISFVQETHCSSETQIDFERDWKGRCIFSNGTKSARGVAILINERLTGIITNTKRDNDGRVVSTELNIDDKTITLTNIYAPNHDIDRRIFFRQLHQYCSTTNTTILGGDFNCCTKTIDKQGGNPKATNTAITELDGLTATHNLIDIWRQQHPRTLGFTWTGKNPYDTTKHIQTRLDKFFITDSITHHITKSDIIPYAHSDHDAVTITIDFKQTKRGPGYWHFNNTLLTDKHFTDEITTFWTDWITKQHDFDNLSDWWDKCKHHFKTIATKHATRRRKKQKRRLDTLRRTTDRLQQQATSGLTTDIEQYLESKEDLRAYELTELRAITLRAKVQFLEEGERSTKFFYNLEKKRQADRTITKITRDDATTTTDTYEMIAETHKFYKELYSADELSDDAAATIFDIDTTKLTDTERDQCEGQVTLDETTYAVKHMTNNKSPGIDGLTTNFYKYFWDILGPHLTTVFNQAFQRGQLTLTQRRGIISLLYKKNDRTKLANWRPISLLTTDYKILAKALAVRLRGVISNIINTDQTANIPGRTINDNVSLIRDALRYANDNNTPLALITIDQLKAFDRVDHHFLFQTLTKFGFGPNFIQWIKTLYTDTTSSVKVNGWFTAFFHLQRGLRQGCPLSAPLYVIMAEILAIHIRTNPNIHGLRPPNAHTDVKLSQYADDTTLLLTDDNSITHVFKTLTLYEHASGAKINKSKCKGLWVGSFKHRTDRLHDFDWYNDYIPDKILGLHFGNIDCSHLTRDARLRKLRNTCNAWKSRYLSFTGKTLIINGLLTSLLWYHATAEPYPKADIKVIEHIVYDFFWSSKAPAINRDILSLPKSHGGFNIHRITTKIAALRLSTLRRLLEPTPANWKFFTAYYLRIAGMQLGILALTQTYKDSQIDKTIPTYHKELLRAWNQLRPHIQRTDPLTERQTILDEPLFLNKNITDETNNCLFNEQWITADLIRVSDLCYIVIPDFLPVLAIHELLSARCLIQTKQQLDKILNALPKQWISTLRIIPPVTNTTKQKPTFAIVKGQTKTDLTKIRTKTFYTLLRDIDDKQPNATLHWRQTYPTLALDKHFWTPTNHDLLTNKQKDFNWKIKHIILPTALRLNRMGVYPTTICHNCNETETLEHLLLHCATLRPFWTTIQQTIDLLTTNTVQLDDETKLFGLRHTGYVLPKPTCNLVNWLLTIAKFSIHKSAVQKRLHDIQVSPICLFNAIRKSHIKMMYRVHKEQNTEQEFLEIWCINNVLASANDY